MGAVIASRSTPKPISQHEAVQVRVAPTSLLNKSFVLTDTSWIMVQSGPCSETPQSFALLSEPCRRCLFLSFSSFSCGLLSLSVFLPSLKLHFLCVVGPVLPDFSNVFLPFSSFSCGLLSFSVVLPCLYPQAHGMVSLHQWRPFSAFHLRWQPHWIAPFPQWHP